MDKFNISILEYLGQIHGGMLVMLSILYDGEYFVATFFYNEEDMVLTISDELEEKIGPIKDHKNYLDILKDILKKIVPFEEIYDRSDPVDLKPYVDKLTDMFGWDLEKIDGVNPGDGEGEQQNDSYENPS